MEFLCIISIIIAAICTIILALYRRQIKLLNEQIKYINEHETNMILTREMSLKEINGLMENLNIFLEKSNEKQIQIKEKDGQLKEVITNISHDIRTPLAALSGYFELLENTQDMEERKKYALIIKDRINCLKEMLEQLFTYVKVQNGDYEFEIESVNIKEETINTLLGFREEFYNSGIEPLISLPDSPIYADVNKMAFTRVIQNVIKNAVVHGGKHFEISMKNINGSIMNVNESIKDISNINNINFANKDYTEITVINDVKNIEEIDIDKVFDRFYKVDKSRSQISTGLGLAIAKDMIEKMGGTISALKEGRKDGDYFIIKIIL